MNGIEEFRVFVAVVMLLLAMSAGCGGCTEESGGTDGLGDSGTSADVAGDVAADSARDTDPASDGGEPSDVPGDVASGEECGIYKTQCGGACIDTSTDPDNCGGCGNVCGHDEVCSGGRCVDQGECMSGLSPCDRRCVDLDTDNDHCGGCDQSCGADQGCQSGSCGSVVELDPAPAKCDDGGPPINVDVGSDAVDTCTGRMAERTFRWALCSCEDITINTSFLADAYDSRLGPYMPGGLGGSVGANGVFSGNNDMQISGTLWVAGDGGLSLINDNTVGQRLHVGGAVDLNRMSVADDAYVEGPFNVRGGIDIGGTLYYPPGPDPGRGVNYADIQRQPVDVLPPCTECEPDDRIPVGDIVDSHVSNNDNGLIGLDADVLNNPATGDSLRLDLPCGHYYLSAIEGGGSTTVVAHGNTALYIGGDVNPGGTLTITLTPDAELDVFVAGDVLANTEIYLGSANYPALMRMYIGGDNGLVVNNRLRAAANVYAVPGGVTNENRTEIFGALYTQQFSSQTEAQFHYDRRVATVGEDCRDEPDPDPDPDPDADAGYPDADDEPDAGDDPPDECSTQDQGCSADGDCCSPLTCEDGVCSLLSCQPLLDDCTDHIECCSGTCSSGTCVGG